MHPDAPLILMSALASTATVLILLLHAIWLVITYALRQRGRRVTFLRHNWQKLQEEIATVRSVEERARYERWSGWLRYTYWVWAMTMITLALLALFIYT